MATTGDSLGGVLAGANVETIARVPVVATWIVDGHSRTELVAMAAKKWGIAPRSTDRLIAAARAELVAGWQVQREELVAVLLSRTDRVYRKAMATANHGAALGAINAAARLGKL